eukprot:TRINITY_DN53811_c0_g1_i1.p1 TRINITY_DN53811_c0_g1~~TRINITY_DN53811_c0_g1_i1.p1  ORF type:complete len:466 (+),score=45.58 TRINITY_DN53811_c0_g1_i1:28-1398(+)
MASIAIHPRPSYAETEVESQPPSPPVPQPPAEPDRILSLPSGANHILPCLSFISVRLFALFCIVLIFGLYYVFVPLGPPVKGIKRNWTYAVLQPFVVRSAACLGDAIFTLHTAVNPFGPESIVLPIHIIAALSALGGALTNLTLTIPVAFAGCYPFNWFAGQIVTEGLFYSVITLITPRMVPDLHREEQKRIVGVVNTSANGYLFGIIVSIAFLVGFYKTSGALQLFIVLVYNSLMQVCKLLMRRHHIKHELPPRVHFLLVVPLNLDQDLFLCFAHPGAAKTNTLVLMLLGQGFSGILRALSYTTPYNRVMHHCIPSLKRTSQGIVLRILDDVSALSAQAVAPFLFVALSYGFNNSVNRLYYPFAAISHDQFRLGVALAAASGALGAVQLVAFVCFLEGVLHIPLRAVLRESCGGAMFHLAVASYCTNAVVQVTMVIQRHCNILSLLQAHLYPWAQ